MKKQVSIFLTLALIVQTILSAITLPAYAADESEKTAYAPPESPAVTYNMNVDWKFKKAEGGQEYPLAKALASVAKDGKQFYEMDYDDSAWEDVSIPHPINAIDSFDGAAFDAGEGGLYRGFMFYRKKVTIPAEDAGKKLFLEFEAFRQSVYVYVNGEIAGYYEAGIAPVGFDITAYAKAGEENIIAVATDNASDRGQSDSSKVTHETKPGSAPGAADGYGYQWNTKDFNEVQGGITGNVNLYAKSKVYQTLPLYNNLKTTGNYIYGTDYDIDSKTVTVNVKAEVRNETDADKDVTLEVKVVDMDGKLVHEFANDGKAKAAMDKDAHFMNMVPDDAYDENPAATDISTVDVSYIDASYKAEGMRFWSDKDPYLYTIYTILKDGDEVIDVEKTVTGFRKIEYNITEGLKINDRQTYLKGYAQRSTDEWAVIGVANDWLNDIDMSWVRESNANHIRWMHVAAKPAQIRAGDKYGVISTCPAGDKEGDTDGRAWDQRVEAMRDTMIYFRNSPSVLFWEAGNNAITAEHMQEMTDLRKELDPNGGRFAGSRTISSVDQIQAAEYVGTMLNRHAAGAKGSMTSANGKYMPIMETEYARDEAPRRVWDDFSPPDYDYVNKWLGSGGAKKDGYDIWDETSEDFSVVNAKAYDEFYSGRVGGGGSELYTGAAIMVWSDSNMHNRNTYSENCRTSGKVDAVRIKKDAFYALQAVQSEEPKIHIVGHWSYPQLTDETYWYTEKVWKDGDPGFWDYTTEKKQRDPKNKTVYVIGSPDVKKVELYINDELVKTDSKPDNNFVYAFSEIDVTQSGKVSAKAYDDTGELVAEDEIETAGEPDHIKLTPMTGPDGLIADGSDIMYFDVEVVDEEDRVCPLNYDRIDLSLSGEGVLLGGYNSGVGDKITTNKVSNNQGYTNAECGVNRVFVRSTRNAGAITLSATMDGLGTFQYTLNSEAFDNTNGLSTQMQRTYALGEQKEIVAQKVEAFNPLGAAVKADFSENGNTAVVEEVDDNIYYTVDVNGEEITVTDETRARASSMSGVYGPGNEVLEKLYACGAIKDYSISETDPKVISFTTNEDKTYTVQVGQNAIHGPGLPDEGTEITEDCAEIGGQVFVNYSAVFQGYIPGVKVQMDTKALKCSILYGAASASGVSLSYEDGKVAVKAADKAVANAKVIFAAYNADNTLGAVDISKVVNVSANGMTKLDIPEEIAAVGGKIKVMLWGSVEGLDALCDAITITPASLSSAGFELMDVDYTKYQKVQYEENFNTNTQTDGPDGTGYLKADADDTYGYKGVGVYLASDSILSLDFRLDSASANMHVADSKGKNFGPYFSVNGTTFRTQTGGSSWQTLGEVNVGEWYSMELEGKMGVANAHEVFRLYKWEDGVKTLIATQNNLNLRNFGNAGKGVADTLLLGKDMCIDNVKVTSIYASDVAVSALSTDIKASESVLCSALATYKGGEVNAPAYTWTVHDMDGNVIESDDVKVNESGMLLTTKDAVTQTVKVRATAQTEGNPYGEVEIKITAVDTSQDTFDKIEITPEKNYVRYGEDTKITPTVSMAGAPVTPADGDIVWEVYNEANVRQVKNIGITVNNGVVSVDENVIPQKITVRASSKSGGASTSVALDIKPGKMILADEEGSGDIYVTGDACEELVSGLELKEGSWDGTGYYNITAARDFAGFASDTNEHVLYSADMKFNSENAGWVVWNGAKGKQGLQIKYNGGRLGIVQDSKTTPTYLDVDQESWYNVQIMCSTGATPNSYANLIVYKYVDGKRVNPETGDEGVPFIAAGIPMRNLSESQANHVEIQAGTSVDNVYCIKTVPDKITVSVDKDTMFAGQSIQGTAVASRDGAPFGYISSDLIKWVVYDGDNTNVLKSSLITVDASGKLTVDALADSQTVYLRAATVDGSLYDAVKVTIQSSDIFTINKIGFDEDYTKVRALYVTKNFSYSDTVTFAVCVYNSDETELKSVTTRKMTAKNIARGEEPVAISMDAPMPEGFDKNSDVVYVYTVTSVSENEAVTEDDGTIGAAFEANKVKFTKLPEFDASRPVIVLVLKPDTVTTSVADEDIVYLKQYTGASLAELSEINLGSAPSGDYIVKMAGKKDGMSVINTGIIKK